MRKAAERLALFFLAVTIYRAALLMADGLALGWMGQALAVGIAVGVFVSAYFFGILPFWPKVLVALPALALFMVIDTAFNFMEVVRTLSTANFVPKDANFLEMSAADIRWAMQWMGIVVGIFPSVATAILGLMQAQANKMQWPEKQSWFGQVGVAFMAKLGIERPAPTAREGVIITKPEEIQPRSNGRRTVAAKNSLSAEQRAALPGMTDGQIVSMYGIKPRTARKWKSDVKNGNW